MNEKNGIGESKPKQSQRQGESAPDLPVGRTYAVEPLANRVGKVLSILENWACCRCKQRTFVCKTWRWKGGNRFFRNLNFSTRTRHVLILDAQYFHLIRT